jgi:hypothetical protein
MEEDIEIYDNNVQEQNEGNFFDQNYNTNIENEKGELHHQMLNLAKYNQIKNKNDNLTTSSMQNQPSSSNGEKSWFRKNIKLNDDNYQTNNKEIVEIEKNGDDNSSDENLEDGENENEENESIEAEGDNVSENDENNNNNMNNEEIEVGKKGFIENFLLAKKSENVFSEKYSKINEKFDTMIKKVEEIVLKVSNIGDVNKELERRIENYQSYFVGKVEYEKLIEEFNGHVKKLSSGLSIDNSN